MHSQKSRIKMLLGFLACIALSPASASADPVGDLLEFSHVGEQMMASQGKGHADIKKEIPTKQTVGLPVYPGAFYTGAMAGEGMLPTIVMASGDPIETIKEWYANQDGLSYEDTFQTFYVGEKYLMMQSEAVFLQDISKDPSVSVGGLVFNMDGMKTQISISYIPKAETE